MTFDYTTLTAQEAETLLAILEERSRVARQDWERRAARQDWDNCQQRQAEATIEARAYEKLYIYRRSQHFNGAPWQPSERILYHWVELIFPHNVSFDPDDVEAMMREQRAMFD